MSEPENDPQDKSALPDSAETENDLSRMPAVGPGTGISLSRSGELSVLRLAGSIDIGTAAELQAALLKALRGSRQIQVCAEALTDVDVTALQLLWAARRAAVSEGAGFLVSGAPALEPQLAEWGMEALLIFA